MLLFLQIKHMDKYECLKIFSTNITNLLNTFSSYQEEFALEKDFYLFVQLSRDEVLNCSKTAVSILAVVNG